MDLSKKWLADYVDLDIEDREFAEAITISGSKVESYKQEGEGLKNIVVGHLLSLKKHENADKLWVCQVDCGGDAPLQIVTAAQNLTEGDYVPVALHNSVVAGGTKITKGKMRGEVSEGMMCSVAELGVTVHDFPYAIEDGIFILGDDCEKVPGMDIREAIGLNDTVTEFEITSNRPDCMCVIGLAREAAATFDVPLKLHTPEVKAGEGDVNDLLKVDIEAADKCYRYAGAVVKNVRVAPSPRWMRERLRACGVRPINNIVDITNYVMLEYGQPMHAFDLRFLEGNHVVVRNAKAGESITTLDGIERPLDDTMLVIADEKKPVAVAGVMGGEYSGIMDDTNTIVFESACFNGPSVRRTAKKLGMRTESSARFEKQLNPDDCDLCLKRALELVQLFDAGDVVNGIIDVYPTPKEVVTLPFDPDWVNKFIGIDCPSDEQKAILEKIGFQVEDGVITAPSFRIDIESQADISEEIARFYGYNNIPNTQLRGTADASLTDRQKFNRLVENTLLSSGLSETQTFSFISPKTYDKLCLPEDSDLRKNIVISNPLGEDTSVMRRTALGSMMEVLSRNYNNRNPKAFLYEVATVYVPHDTLDELPDEDQEIVIGMYGQDADYFKVKGILENLLDTVGIREYDVVPVTDHPSFHPGRTAAIQVEGKQLAVLGEVHPNVRGNYEIKARTYAALVDMELLEECSDLVRLYKQLPKYPVTTRDLAFVVDKITPVLVLEKAIKRAAGNILESIELFDVYAGEQIGKGKKSVAFNLIFRAEDRTLTDDECNNAVKKAIAAAEKLGAELRS
ncbi:MAG: phenylalanine--tRNA ligase subunit beta [Acutalibacteraceae bacterium]|nr:phenylalanine--tRNA ligase subunit beta [Acutalibacteraceae bacterium]